MAQYGAGPPQPGSRLPGAQLADLFFPINGLDVSVSFEWQTPDTTPEGVNVRTFEPSTNRARGGQRWGLSKYIEQMLPLDYTSGSPAIQMLQVIVDPSATALGVSYPPYGGYAIPSLVFIGGYLTFPYGSGFPPSTPANLLVLKANNQTKTAGTKFTFTGHQFTIAQGSLQSGDTINSCVFQSSGAPASAQVGTYVINISSPSLTITSGTTYYIVFETGVMTVGGLLVVEKDSSFLSGNASSTPTTVSITLTNAVATGDYIAVVAFCENATIDPGGPSIITPSVSGVTDSLRNTYSQLNTGTAASSAVLGAQTNYGNGGVSIYWAVAQTSGACTVTASFGSLINTSSGYANYTIGFTVVLMRGGARLTPIDGQGANSGTLTGSLAYGATAGPWNETAGVSVSTGGDVVVAGAMFSSAPTTLGGGNTFQSPLLAQYGLYDFCTAYDPAPASGTYTCTTTLGSITQNSYTSVSYSLQWTIVAASFKP